VSSPPFATSDWPWLSFYIIYHTGNRDRLLVDLVRPLVRTLLQEGLIDGFFFVRYSLGGPHIRLRLKVSPGCEVKVREAVHRDGESFLRAHPSPAAVPEPEIRKMIESRGQQDPREGEDVVFEDNALLEIPFEPETERYGGADLLSGSLDFFARSSARALQLLTRQASTAKGDWLAVALRLQVRHQLGFARGVEELKSFISARQAGASESASRIRMHADQVFERNEGRLPLLVRNEIERLAGDLSPLDDSEAARQLSHQLADAAEATRLNVFRSQIHMTANRLGLRNVDEVYLARLLWRALQRLEAADAAAWSRLGDLLARRAERSPYPDQRLQDLLLECL
jgi:Lantibiotic biosynthesis dehydratase C-term